MIFTLFVDSVPPAFFESPDFPEGYVTVHFRHHDIHTDQVVRLRALLGSAKRCHRLPAVNRDMAFAIFGQKRLQQKSAREVIFDDKCAHLGDPLLRLDYTYPDSFRVDLRSSNCSSRWGSKGQGAAQLPRCRRFLRLEAERSQGLGRHRGSRSLEGMRLQLRAPLASPASSLSSTCATAVGRRSRTQ